MPSNVMTKPAAHAPHPFTQEADLVRLLHTLPESLLLATIHDRVAANDLAWLERMVQSGFFKARPPADMDGASPHDVQALYDQWEVRCKAMMGVMGQAHLAHPNPLVTGYSTSHPEFLAEFVMPPDRKLFFASFCQDLCEQALLWQGALKNSPAIDMLMAKTMGLSAMLDRPDVLARLVQAFPLAVNKFFDEQSIGKGMFSSACDETQTMAVGPLFCALQFSSPDCVKLLLPLFKKDKGLYLSYKEDDFSSAESIGPLSSFSHMCHRGRVDAMTPLVTWLVEQSGGESSWEKKDLRAKLSRLMPGADNNSQTNKNARMIPAFVDAGVADFDPVNSVLKGVKFNRQYVLDHFQGRIDWDAFASVSNECLEALKIAIEKNRTKGLSWLIAQAKDSGHEKEFLGAFVLANDGTGTGTVVHAVARALVSSKAGVAVLPHVLELGLSADALTNDGETLKSVAAKFSRGANEVLFSFAACEQARAALHEIENQIPEARRSCRLS